MALPKGDRNVSPSNSNHHHHHHHHHRSCPSLLHAFDEIVKDIDNIPEFLRAQKATLRFPEVLLFLMVQAERDVANNSCRIPEQQACIGWTLNGQAIVIRNKDELLNKLLPLAFPVSSKFTSFTRKMYRWGFRQASSIAGDHQGGQRTRTVMNECSNDNIINKRKTNSNEITFFHPFFQRDNKALAASMTSTTAEGTRRALSAAKKLPKKRRHNKVTLSEPIISRQQHEHNGGTSQILDQMDKISNDPSQGFFAAISNTDVNHSQQYPQGRQSIGMDSYAMKSSPTEQAAIDTTPFLSNIPHSSLLVTPHILPSTSNLHNGHDDNAITPPLLIASSPPNITTFMTIPRALPQAPAPLSSVDNSTCGLHGLGSNDHQLLRQLLEGSHISQMVEAPFIKHALQQLLIIQQQQHQSILPACPPHHNYNGLFPENLSTDIQSMGWTLR